MRKSKTITQATVKAKTTPGIENRHLILAGGPNNAKGIAALEIAFQHVAARGHGRIHIVSEELNRTQLQSILRDKTSDSPTLRKVAKLAEASTARPTLTHLPVTENWYFKVDPVSFQPGTVVILMNPKWTQDSRRQFYEELRDQVTVIEVINTHQKVTPFLTNQRVYYVTGNWENEPVYQAG